MHVKCYLSEYSLFNNFIQSACVSAQ